MKIKLNLASTYLFITFIWIIAFQNPGFGQVDTQKQPELRQGAYYTEEAGKQNLQGL
jgi:hypothetical protein